MPRRRDLTGEERALWGRVADSARPMHPHKAGNPPDVARDGTVAPLQKDRMDSDRALEARAAAAPADLPLARRPPGKGPALPTVTVDLAPDPMQAALAATPAMDRGRYDDLRRGRLRPEARIDLHGMTADRAHRELGAFIHRAHAQDRRLLLVITGKGRQSAEDTGPMPSRVGVLRHSLPRWLALPDLKPMVLDLVPAHLRHGGHGAWYVYLRRRK